MISKSTIVRQHSDIVSSPCDGETVMMSIEKGNYYGMEPVASRIWELIGKPAKVGDIIDMLTDEYEVSHEDCEKDVLYFLNELASDNMIEVVF